MPSNAKLAGLAALVAPALAAFGPAYSTGPTSSGVFITEATSTLIVPEGNLPFDGDFSLWCGMGTSAGDLIQSIVNRTPNNSPGTDTPCETVTSDNEWCGFTYTLFDDGYQDIGTQTNVVAGDYMTFKYVYDSSTDSYTQYLETNGVVASTLTTSDGGALGWGTATECAAEDCGTFPSHQWINTVITLSAADPDYYQTQGQSEGVTASDFTTSDGGLTWSVDTITIPGYTY